MSFPCPNCRQHTFGWKARLSASATLPYQCSSCRVFAAGIPGVLLEWLYALLSTGLGIGSLAVCVLVGSWWPILVGGVLAVPVLPSLMRLRSPFLVVSPATVKRARRKQALVWAVIVAAVVLAGMFSS